MVGHFFFFFFNYCCIVISCHGTENEYNHQLFSKNPNHKLDEFVYGTDYYDD